MWQSSSLMILVQVWLSYFLPFIKQNEMTQTILYDNCFIQAHMKISTCFNEESNEEFVKFYKIVADRFYNNKLLVYRYRSITYFLIVITMIISHIGLYIVYLNLNWRTDFFPIFNLNDVCIFVFNFIVLILRIINIFMHPYCKSMFFGSNRVLFVIHASDLDYEKLNKIDIMMKEMKKLYRTSYMPQIIIIRYKVIDRDYVLQDAIPITGTESTLHALLCPFYESNSNSPTTLRNIVYYTFQDIDHDMENSLSFAFWKLDKSIKDAFLKSTILWNIKHIKQIRLATSIMKYDGVLGKPDVDTMVD